MHRDHMILLIKQTISNWEIRLIPRLTQDVCCCGYQSALNWINPPTLFNDWYCMRKYYEDSMVTIRLLIYSIAMGPQMKHISHALPRSSITSTLYEHTHITKAIVTFVGGREYLLESSLCLLERSSSYREPVNNLYIIMFIQSTFGKSILLISSILHDQRFLFRALFDNPCTF